MATMLAGSTFQSVYDAQWGKISPVPQGIQKIGEFAVKKANEKNSWNLKFNVVYKLWEMNIAPDFGILYLLHLNALGNDMVKNHHAIVWVLPKACVTDCCDMMLVSFKTLED